MGSFANVTKILYVPKSRGVEINGKVEGEILDYKKITRGFANSYKYSVNNILIEKKIVIINILIVINASLMQKAEISI